MQAAGQITHGRCMLQQRPAKRACCAGTRRSHGNSAAISRVPSCVETKTHKGTMRRSSKGRGSNRVQATSGIGGGRPGLVAGADLAFLTEAAKLADNSAGVTQPHPNAATILVSCTGRELARAFLRAQGTVSPEVSAVLQAGESARGATAYLNLESGDCHGDASAVEALVKGGVSRVVVGLRHPLAHLRGVAVQQLLAAGVAVDVLGEAGYKEEDELEVAAAFDACMQVNAPLLHRAALKQPMSVLKYAMTLDGKIATHTGHSAWVSSPQSRAMVFAMRSRSDAVVVGGNTVRRDNPRLTTRREGGHMPARVVMSRTLELPEDANLWDVSTAPTIVMTQRGARHSFQQHLKQCGVEVVEFDFLTPEHVAAYCFERGYLQVFWECGGTLAAPAISSGTIHRVMAFVAPKIIGGCRAPTPIGDLGFVEMTQAVNLVDTCWQQVGPDLLLTGYLPSSGGLTALETMISTTSHPLLRHVTSSNAPTPPSSTHAPPPLWSSRPPLFSTPKPIMFYKAWDEFGALSNFSAHPILMPELSTSRYQPACHDTAPAVVPLSSPLLDMQASAPPSPPPAHAGRVNSGSPSPTSATPPASASPDTSPAMSQAELLPNISGANGISGIGASSVTSANGALRNGVALRQREWRSVEHYYQAQKYWVPSSLESMAILEEIAAAESPEEAAHVGRRCAIISPHLVRPDWDMVKLDVMYSALRAKFSTHQGPRKMLLSTLRSSGGVSQGAQIRLAESSPHDFFWGVGVDGRGANHLGRLLMQLREELAREDGDVAKGEQKRERQSVAS